MGANCFSDKIWEDAGATIIAGRNSRRKTVHNLRLFFLRKSIFDCWVEVVR
jgi:hypothetical protein